MSKQEKTQSKVTEGGSALSRYQATIVGNRAFSTLLYYELCMWIGALPGALGLVMRKLSWPRLFKQCGRGTVFGAHVTLRHPGRISLGEQVVIGDGCILDARSEGKETAISIGNNTILANYTMLSSKNGEIHVGERVGIGAQTVIHSVNQSPVEIGNDVLIGPHCYLAGGGNYNTEDLSTPISTQGLRDEPGIQLADNIWLGAKVTVLSGVVMSTGSVAAAGAVVTRDVPQNGICAGVPARVVKSGNTRIRAG